MRYARQTRAGRVRCTRPIAAGVIESAVIDHLRARAQTVDPQEVAAAIDERFEDDLAHVRAMRADAPARIAARAREMDGLIRLIPTLLLCGAAQESGGAPRSS